MHEDVAMEFARWLHPGFAIWRNDRIKELFKHGITATEATIENILNDPASTIKILQALQTEREEKAKLQSVNKEQQQQLEIAQAEQTRLQLEVQRKDTIIEEQAPDVAFAQTIKASGTNIKLGDFAKVLSSNGYIIGPNRIFDWMRENGFIFGKKNRPAQRYIDMGLLTFHESPVPGKYHRDGSPVIGLTPYITPKGQHYIIERLNDGRLYIERQILKLQPQQLSINY